MSTPWSSNVEQAQHSEEGTAAATAAASRQQASDERGKRSRDYQSIHRALLYMELLQSSLFEEAMQRTWHAIWHRRFLPLPLVPVLCCNALLPHARLQHRGAVMEALSHSFDGTDRTGGWMAHHAQPSSSRQGFQSMAQQQQQQQRSAPPTFMAGLRSSMMLACFLRCRRLGLFLPCTRGAEERP